MLLWSFFSVFLLQGSVKLQRCVLRASAVSCALYFVVPNAPAPRLITIKLLIQANYRTKYSNGR